MGSGIGVVHLMPDGTIAPEVMTRQEVERFLRVDTAPHPVRVINNLIETKKLKAKRIGRYNYFRLTDVLAFLEGAEE